MSVSLIDHTEIAASRPTGLYRDKAKAMALVRLLGGEIFDDMEAVLLTISALDDIDAKDARGEYLNRGVVLDITGARYGQKRRLSGAIPLLYFGWDDDANALGWGEEDDELAGGSWYEDGQALTADAVMDDATYRVAVRMRRLKNSSQIVTFETIVASLLYIFPDLAELGIYALVLNEVTGAILLGIGRQPTAMEVALLRYTGAFPKPAGIGIECSWWPAATGVFTFDDDPDPNGAGWGEEGDPDAGGVFAEEF